MDTLQSAARRACEQEPLSDRELRDGIAVRVVSCVRANDADITQKPSGFVWSVLVLVREGVRAETLRTSGVKVLACLLGEGLPTVRGPLATGRVEHAGSYWTVHEYAVDVPRRLMWFGFKAGFARCFVGRRRRNELVHDHFDRINNAAANEAGYKEWLRAHRAFLATFKPPASELRISIVCPLYKTPPVYLRAMIDSVLAQTFERWELVLVNASPDDEGVCATLSEYADPRIKVVPCPENYGIAGNTNVGLKHCAGDYVCFLDHDDFVEPQALAAMVQAIEASETPVDLVYCDEDSVDENGGDNKIPLFKPGRNIDLLYSNNYVIHWLMVSRYVLDHSERSGKEVDGAQDYDLTFKALECARGVVHVPYVLYHWRIHSGSTNGSNGGNPGAKRWAQESGRRAIAEHLERRDLSASVTCEKVAFTYRTDFTGDAIQGQMLACISLGEPCQALRAALGECGVAKTTVLPKDAPAVEVSQALEAFIGSADFALVLDGSLALSAEDVQCAASYFVRSEVFALSPRVLRKDGLLDSAGCIAMPDGRLCKMGHGLPASDEGYIGRLHRPYSAAVLNADCCFVRLDALAQLAGKEERGCFSAWSHLLASLCLRAYERGMVNVYTPFSIARWTTDTSLLQGMWSGQENDSALLAKMHAGLLAKGDPCHNPNFDPWDAYYRLRPADSE